MATRDPKDNKIIRGSQIYCQIADFKIELKFMPAKYEKIQENFKQYYVASLLGDFLLNNKPKSIDYRISFRWDEIPLFVKKDATIFTKMFTQISKKSIESFYQISIFQLHSLLTEIAHQMAIERGGFLLHASSSVMNNCVNLFSGNSGVGKSTIVKLLNSKYPMFTDDNIIILPKGNEYFSFQLPSLSYETILNNGLKIDNIYFLSHGKRIDKKKLDTKAEDILLSQSYHHKESSKSVYDNITSFSDKMRKRLFYLSFPKNKETVIKYFKKNYG